MPEVKIIGVYRIVPTMESILQSIRFHKYDFLMDKDGNYEDVIYWDNHQNLALIEIQVLGKLSPDILVSTSLGKPSPETQAPYMEYYLDAMGAYLLSEQEAIDHDKRRVCFFLHFVDTRKPLFMGGRKLKLPSRSDLPERLKPFTHYLPVG